MNKKKENKKDNRRDALQASLNACIKKGKSYLTHWVNKLPGLWIKTLDQLYELVTSHYAKQIKKEDETRQLWVLPKTLILDSLEVRQTLLLCSGVFSLLLLSLLVWASVATIDGMAIAPGQVVTSTRIGEIQHLEGGIVKSIQVEEGDRVKKKSDLGCVRRDECVV